MYDYIKIPEITHSETFENLTFDLYLRVLNRTQKNGRRGQSQNGVDVYGYSNKNELVGIQCKVKSKADWEDKRFRTSFIREIEDEVRQAVNFSDNLKEFIIVTTAPRDSVIQSEIRALDERVLNDHGFHVQVMFWDDITEKLTNPVHKDTFKKYYGDLIIREEIIGGVRGKMLSLSVGVEQVDSCYELFLGYIPMKLYYPNKLNYYANSYIIGCFHSNGFDTFPERCFPSDLDEVFRRTTTRDKHLISDWLRSIDLDGEIRSDENNYQFVWTREQYESFCDALREG